MLLTLSVKLLGGIWKVKRLANTTTNPLLRKIFRGLYFYYFDNKGAFIGRGTKWKSTPVFPHGVHGVFISAGSVIGSDCVIFHHVTIGSNTLPGSKGEGSPTIGNNCYIGAGAKIIGKVTIGNNVRIGANAVVFRDIPDNAVVVLQEPKIIIKESLNNAWIYKDQD